MEKLQVGHLDLFQKEFQTLESAYVEWSSAHQAIALMQVKELSAGKMPYLSNPFLVIRKGRPLGVKNKPKSSTKRDTSAFENAKKKRHCGECGLLQDNHDGRTCPTRKSLVTKFAWRHLITRVTDVLADGHYGFHALAFHLRSRGTTNESNS